MAVAAILPAVSLFAAGPRDEKPFIVTAEEYSKAPLSPLLYGNFIELGYGRQVEAMYSEMLFNRSFEHFLPYRDINKSWYDLYFDESDHEKGYEKDGACSTGTTAVMSITAGTPRQGIQEREALSLMKKRSFMA